MASEGRQGQRVHFPGLPPKRLSLTPSDKTEEFLGRYALASVSVSGGRSAGPLEPPPEARDFTYLWVPGLLGNPGQEYLTPNVNALKALGLDSAIVWSIDTVGTSAKNAAILAGLLADRPKPVVLIGHSKGAVDAADALTLYPQARRKVRKFVAIQAPYLGSPMADFYFSTGPTRWWLRNMAQRAGGDPAAIEELTTARRAAFAREHPFPAEEVETYSFVSSVRRWRTVFGLSRAVIRLRTGLASDGLICPEHAVLPGSRVVRLPEADHLDVTLPPCRGWRGWFQSRDWSAPAFAQALVRFLFGVEAGPLDREARRV